jgi:hypothetical protein
MVPHHVAHVRIAVLGPSTPCCAALAGGASPRAMSIISRASSPALSTFGSGSIASDLARGPPLCSTRSSPILRGFDSGSGGGSLSAGVGLGMSEEELLREPSSPTLSMDGAQMSLPEEDLGWTDSPRGAPLMREPGSRTSRSLSPKALPQDSRQIGLGQVTSSSANVQAMMLLLLCRTMQRFRFQSALAVETSSQQLSNKPIC